MIETLIQNFLSVQDTLNKKLHPEWEKQGWAYPDAIFTEATEAYNHLNWEWWRATGRVIDWDQVKLEWIDVAHFLFSEIMVQGEGDALLASAEIYFNERYNNDFSKDIDVVTLKTHLKSFIAAIIVYDLEKTDFLANESSRVPVLGVIIDIFLVMIRLLGMDLQEFYTLFIGKVCLNQLRWKNGYKKGVYTPGSTPPGVDPMTYYVKNWEGVEDNIWLAEFAKTLDPSASDFKAQLEAGLDKRYAEVFTGVWGELESE